MRALAALVVALLAGPPAPAPDGWTQFRGDPALTGVAKATLPATLTLLWTHEAGEGLESSPVVAFGRVYVAAPHALTALDLASGRVLWTYKELDEQGIGESTPAVAGGLVYVGDLGGIVHAVRASDGTRAWTYKTGNEVKAPPVVSGTTVLVGSYDGHVYALDAAKGTLRWKHETQGPVHGAVAVSAGVAWVAGCDEKFRGLLIADGTLVTTVSSGAYTGASPAVRGGRAIFGTFEEEVLAIDLKANRVAWRYKPSERKFPFYSSAAVTADTVVLGGRDKLVHALSAKDGTRRWTFATRARVDSSPAIAGTRVYVGSNDGRLYALELADGKKVWEFEAGAPISSSPAIAGGRLVIAAQDGRVMAFGAGS